MNERLWRLAGWGVVLLVTMVIFGSLPPLLQALITVAAGVAGLLHFVDFGLQERQSAVEGDLSQDGIRRREVSWTSRRTWIAAGMLAWCLWVTIQGFMISITTPLDDIVLWLVAGVILWFVMGNNAELLKKIPRRRSSNIWGVQSGDVDAIQQKGIPSLNDELTRGLLSVRQAEWEERVAEEAAEEARSKERTEEYERAHQTPALSGTIINEWGGFNKQI